MNVEIIVFVVYLLFMLGIGVFFFIRSKGGSDKTYFLGGRQMGPWVSALSAGASDMSAWVLMGLPASIYAAGIGQAWIAIGLGIGYTISWLVEAPRLRRFTIAADDSITVPQYLTNRFLSKSKALQIICAVIFLVAYTVYAASSIKACGTLFNTVIGMDPTLAMYLAALIIIGYTFLGGFSAVCWQPCWSHPSSRWHSFRAVRLPPPWQSCPRAIGTSSATGKTWSPALAGVLATSVCPISSSALCPSAPIRICARVPRSVSPGRC